MLITVPFTKPAARRTAELSVVLPGLVQESPSVKFDFPRPALIVGVHPTVVRNVAAALLLPTADDILCSLDLNQEERFTAREATGLGGESFVTLSALGTVVRELHIHASSDRPVLQARFRWKRDVSGGAIFDDCLVSLAVMYDWEENSRAG